MSCEIVQACVLEETDVFLMRRVTNLDGDNVTQATLSSITGQVFRRDTDAQVGSDITFTISSVIFDTLQTDARWTKDVTGYNFGAAIDGSTYFPDGGVDYRIEVTFTPTSGSPFMAIWLVSAKDVLGS